MHTKNTLHDLVDLYFTWHDIQALLQLYRSNYKISEIEAIFEGRVNTQQIADKFSQLEDINALNVPNHVRRPPLKRVNKVHMLGGTYTV